MNSGIAVCLASNFCMFFLDGPKGSSGNMTQIPILCKYRTKLTKTWSLVIRTTLLIKDTSFPRYRFHVSLWIVTPYFLYKNLHEENKILKKLDFDSFKIPFHILSVWYNVNDYIIWTWSLFLKECNERLSENWHGNLLRKTHERVLILRTRRTKDLDTLQRFRLKFNKFCNLLFVLLLSIWFYCYYL